MRVTIRDVAKAANVSPSTVSLVLNDRPVPISQKTKDKVWETARALNYRPNQLAVGLVTRKTNTLGLIVPDISNFFHATYCEQTESSAGKRNYTTIVHISNDSLEKTISHLYDFDDRGADGVILTRSMFRKPQETAACLEAIGNLRIPVLLTDRVPIERYPGAVVLNDYLGGYLAIKHLLELGHRRIGYITGQRYYPSCSERLRGASDALKEYGVAFDPSLVFEGNFQIDGGARALPFLLGKKVTAIFAFNDMTAFGVYRQMLSYNLSIPKDLSLIGFDDLSFSDILNPPLTTLEYPVRAMAEASVNRLIDRIDGIEESDQARIVFDPILKVRGSTRRISDQI